MADGVTAPDGHELAVRADGLTKRYGDFLAVDGITFAVPSQVCFGVLGPNGAGKTSTIRMITCRFPPDAGDLFVLGMDVTSEARSVKGRLGLVPQENNLDEDLSLLENVELYGRYFGMDGREARARAEELLEFMQLGTKVRDPVKTLSGGMKRRAVIARALVNRPSLVVLDEPTTGLDPQARVLLWDRLRDLKAQGVTLLLTTHYMDEAERLCNDLVIMHEGKILDRGAPSDLVHRHAGRWVAEIELTRAAGADAAKAESQIPGAVRRWERTGHLLHLYADEDHTLLDAIQHIDNQSYHVRPANLEDVFLLSTGREINE